MRLNLPVSNIRRPVPEGEVLVSKSDLKGIVTYCNRVFCEISGYRDGELTGESHNLIRHPDVPAEIFADCWKQLKAARPWHGVIKNRCKNGEYYWVEANISPLIENGEIVGYVSLRYKATDEQIAAAEASYQAIRDGMPAEELPGRSDLGYVTELQQRLAEKITALERYYDRTEEDMRIGSDIMSRITATYSLPDPAVRMMITPATHYSGDVILVSRTPAGNLHVLLADAVGHGLIAAMNLLPLSQIFNAMSNKGFSITRISEELNSKIHLLMPVDRFIGAALVSIDFREQVIEVWNGGIPAPLLVCREGTILHKWQSRNLPLGILDDALFSSKVEIFNYNDDCQLFFFSDGLPEAESPEGKQFGREHIEQLLESAAPDGRFDALTSSLASHLQGHSAHDDISLVMVNLSPADGQKMPAHHLSLARNEEVHSHWRVEICLGEDELKYLDVIPLLTQIVGKINATAEHHSAIYVLLSELFNNALDHGILRLDSAIKHGPEGFEHYLQLREERLHALVGGSICVEIEKVMIDGHYGVKIHVLDSGDGFDYSAIQNSSPESAMQEGQHGRGLALAKSMAYKIEFSGKGNDITAYYICA